MAIPGRHKKDDDFRCFYDPTPARPRPAGSGANPPARPGIQPTYYHIPLKGATPTLYISKTDMDTDLTPSFGKIREKNLVWNKPNGILSRVTQASRSGINQIGVDILKINDSNKQKALAQAKSVLLRQKTDGRYFVRIRGKGGYRLFLSKKVGNNVTFTEITRFANSTQRTPRTNPLITPAPRRSITPRPLKIWGSNIGGKNYTVDIKAVRRAQTSGNTKLVPRFAVKASKLGGSNQGTICFRIKYGPNKYKTFMLRQYETGSGNLRRKVSIRPGKLYVVYITSEKLVGVKSVPRKKQLTQHASATTVANVGRAKSISIPTIYSKDNPPNTVQFAKSKQATIFLLYDWQRSYGTYQNNWAKTIGI